MSENKPELRFTKRGVVALTTTAAIGGCVIGYGFPRVQDRLTHDYGCATTYTGDNTNVATAALNARIELGLPVNDLPLERAITDATPRDEKFADGTAVKTCIDYDALAFGNNWGAVVTVQG